MNQDNQTPLMKQYFAIKEQFPDAVLLFQVGDFYELFFEDAKTVSAFLAIALTKRGKNSGEDIPLCGVPVHALQHYLLKLVRGGFKVVLCDQITKPQPGKMVERAVSQVFTPGTLTDSLMLDDKSASYLLSFYPGKEMWGLVFTEVLSAQMFATVVPAENVRMVESELVRFFPDEILLLEHHVQQFGVYFRKQGYVVSSVACATDLVGVDVPALWVEKQFSEAIVARVRQSEAMAQSLHLLYWYLQKNQQRSLEQFKTIQFYQPNDYVVLDASTQKNLELVNNMHDGGRKNTLLSVLDKSITPMGSRTIKKWLLRPLIQKHAILQRQEVVACIAGKIGTMQRLEELFASLADLERVVGRIALGRAGLPDYRALQQTLSIIPAIKELLHEHEDVHLISAIQEKWGDFSPLVALLECALNDEPDSPWLIKKGFDLELDRLRDLVQDSQKAVLQLEQREILRTGISSLKIRYNNISGYYVEVTKPNLDQVPADYTHQQTLVNRTRFTMQELKDLERDIVRAQNEIEHVEQEVFARVKRAVEEQLAPLRICAQTLAYLDALLGFARAAYQYGYVAPTFVESRDIVIEQGRHPVVEAVNRNQFVPNNTNLTDSESLWILTGPNMGGKSTYLRQVALICLMAQIGSFVPVRAAQLPILDRVFTRIGSGDNVAQGKSTFLVEMEETAAICTQATKNSLIILDEVGRGTSTFDGMALAQAIVEYLVVQVQARCLFATHYHELTHLKDHFPDIANYFMASKRTADGILFLYQLVPGASEGSFGLEVAKLAQLPDAIIVRAFQVLQSLAMQEVRREDGLFKEGIGGAVVSHEMLPRKAQDNRFLKNDSINSDLLKTGEVSRPPSPLCSDLSTSLKIEGALGVDSVRPELVEGLPRKRQNERIHLEQQLAFYKKILEELQSVSSDELSPKKAFDILWRIKEQLD